MKRRLFLKSSTVGVGGAIVIPTLFFGCPPPTPATFDGIGLFMDSAELFDSGIAELRLAGSGPLASAEAEDVTLAGTGEVDEIGISEQIQRGVAAVPAELDANFAESSLVMVGAAESLYLSGPEMFAEDSFAGAEAELAEDFAFLKVLKASTLLASAAEADPEPERKGYAAAEMVASAEKVHESIELGAESEMIETSEHLLAYSEEYVGAAETWSAENAFVEGVFTYGEAAIHYAESRHLDGGDNLLVSSDNIELSTNYFAEGFDSLNAEAEIFNSETASSSAEMLIPSLNLMAESKIYVNMAQGESALLGAETMAEGAFEIYSDAESNVTNMGNGGAELDIGADHFISGTYSFISAEKYTGLSGYYLEAAETLSENPSGFAEAEAEAEIILTTELLMPASELFHSSAEALQSIELTDGVESLVPAVNDILTGAEHLESIATSAEAEIGAAEIMEGAELAEAGAIECFENPSEFLGSGSESIEIGSFGIMQGAAEFIEGYQ